MPHTLMTSHEADARCESGGGTWLPWYVVQTHQGKEFDAYLRLSTFRAYLPTEVKRRVVLKNGRPLWENGAKKREEVLRPFFLRYLFVTFDVAKDDWPLINYAECVSQLLCHRDGEQIRPMKLPDGFVESLQARGRAGDGGIDLDREREGSLPDANWLAGQSAVVREGPFSSFVAVIEANDTERVNLLLSIFGRQTRVEMPLSSVEVL